MEQTCLFIAGAAVATGLIIAWYPRIEHHRQVLKFVRAPHTRSVLHWLSGVDEYCIVPVGFSLHSSSSEGLGDETILGLISYTTFQKALTAKKPSSDQNHLRCIIQETLLHYAQLVGTGTPPLGLGAWPTLLKKHESELRSLLGKSYPLVLETLFPTPWFKRFIPGFGKAAK